MTEFERAAAARRKHQDALFALPGVVAIGLGMAPKKDPHIIVYTKFAEVEVPADLDGVPVVVKIVGDVRAGEGEEDG